jgi:cytoskeletal protein CcmA (bactofilin family)
MGKNPKTDQAETNTSADNKAGVQANHTSYNYAQSHTQTEAHSTTPTSATTTTAAASTPTAARPAAHEHSNVGGAGTTTRAVTESESMARDIKEGTLSGFVGSGTVLTGEANFKAMLRVDGHLSGRVNSEAGTLIVGTSGQVDANIEVAVATIHGTVNGDIIASQRLELGRTAKVTGNIQTPSLMIEQGAVFEGSCRMAQLKNAQEKGRDTKAHDERPTLDTSRMKPINTNGGTTTSNITNVSDVAS